MLALFFVLVFLTVAALLWSALMLARTREDPLRDRLEELQMQAMVNPSRAPRRRAGGGLANFFLYLISLVPGGDDWLRRSERELNQAGIRRREALAVYTAGHLLFFAAALAGMAWVQRNNTGITWLTGMVAGAILGWLLPQQFLHYLVRRYRRKLQEALPDMVDMLGVVLGTGLALDQAMLRVGEEMQFIYPELANEFLTVVMQVKAGQERSRAFQQLVRRTGVEDIKSLAAMIVQSERFGTSLAQALKVYADALRTRRRLRAEAAVGRAGVKMLFPIVFFILPVLFVITLVPGLLSVLDNLQFIGRPR
ncbi:MAG: type II secretion system F family protein [Bryobacterales bacterium]|nr:type II secretion system F family protein [Bryobacteraceae bacterium]MDW8131540.1 type II secretion system F family protein [Bryobacterales bacterium]